MLYESIGLPVGQSAQAAWEYVPPWPGDDCVGGIYDDETGEVIDPCDDDDDCEDKGSDGGGGDDGSDSNDEDGECEDDSDGGNGGDDGNGGGGEPCDEDDEPDDEGNDGVPEETEKEDDDENADPVIISTGEFVTKQWDLRTRQEGELFSINRRYGNQSSSDRGFGQKWDSNIYARVEDGATEALVYTIKRVPVHFVKSGSDYTGVSGQTLVKSGSQYIYGRRNGVTYYFDDAGTVLSKTLRTGQAFVWAYDGTGKLTAVQDGSSNDIYKFYYDNTLITKLEDVDGGRNVVYEYDTIAGDLTRVAGSCGSCTPIPEKRYEYDASHNLVTKRNSSNQVVLVNLYDGQDRVTKQIQEAGVEAIFDYSDHANGHYRYVSFSNMTKDFYKDNRNNLTKIVRTGNVRGTAETFTWLYEYNANDLQTRKTLPSGRIVDTPRDSNGRLAAYILYDATTPISKYRYYYGAYGRTTRVTDANGVHTDTLYDGSGNMTKRIIDPSGLDITTTWEYDTNNSNRITRHTAAAGTSEAQVSDSLYDSNGFLTKSITDPSDVAITVSYDRDTSGRVTARYDARGQTWNNYYATSGKLTKSVNPSGRTVLNTYNDDQHLITKTVQDAETNPNITLTTVYLYNGFGQLTRITAPGNRNTDYDYDNEGRQDYVKTPDGVESFAVYGVRNGESYQSKVYDSAGDVTITKLTLYYDGERHITKTTDANGNMLVKNRQYDSYGRLTRSTDALDNYVVFKYDDAGRLTQRINYDSGNTARSESRIAYDNAGRTTSTRRLASPGGSTSNSDALVEMDYDDAGRLLTQTAYLSGTTDKSKQISFYNNAGQITKQSRDDGPTITFLYDTTDLTKQTVDPDTLALATSFAYDELGRTTRTTNPDSTYSVVMYDGLGRVTKSIQYDSGNTAFAATVPLYHDTLGLVTKTYQISDPANRLTFIAATDPATESVYTAFGRLTKTIDPNANATTYDYDSLGRQITTTDPASNKSIVHYDNADRVLTRISLDYDGANYITFKTAFEHDARNRMTKTIGQGPDGDITSGADNLITTVWYDARGQVTQTQDPASTNTAQAYDDLGRLTRQTEDASGGGIARYTDYAYDRANRLTRLTGYTSDATGSQNTDYLYTKAGVLTLTTYPDSGTVSLAFDSVNRVTRRTDPRGINLDFAYDSMGRLLTKNQSTNIYWTFTYDNAGRRSLSMKGTSAGGIQIARSNLLYDGLGRLTYDGQIIRGLSGKQVRYVYDKAGNITAEYYPSGSLTISRTVTGLNQTNLISRNGTQLADYDYVGRRTDDLTYETGANDVQADRIYDGAARMTRLTWSQTGNTLPDFSYYFDSGGNITRKTHEHRASNPVEDYTIDGLYRLTNARYDSRTLTHGFTYDDLGNRLTFDENANQTTGLYNEVNELTKLDAAQVYYDAAGNLTRDAAGGNGPYSYYYDADNKLTKVTNSGGDVATYEYDALGRRIEFIDSVNTVTKLYYHEGGRDRVIEEYNGAATPARQRYFVWGNYVDELLMYYEDSDTADYFVTHNHLFSPAALVSNDGTIQETYEYDAYGKPTIYTATSSGGGDNDWWDGDETTATVSAKNLSYLFTGREFDSLDTDGALPLYYYRARTYSPRLMRFLQRDPAGYVDGINRYAAYHVMHKDLDPTGLATIYVGFYGMGDPSLYGNIWLKNLVADKLGVILYRNKHRSAATRDLLGKLDTNKDKKIQKGEASAHSIRLFGYSAGAGSAIKLSEALNKKSGQKEEGYELCGPVPIAKLVAIDPAGAMGLHVEDNVTNFVNYYQTRTGYGEFDALDSAGSKIGTWKVGGLSNLIHGSKISSKAKSTSQTKVNKTWGSNVVQRAPLYHWATLPPGTAILRMTGSKVNHDTMPWFVAGNAVSALK